MFNAVFLSAIPLNQSLVPQITEAGTPFSTPSEVVSTKQSVGEVTAEKTQQVANKTLDEQVIRKKKSLYAQLLMSTYLYAATKEKECLNKDLVPVPKIEKTVTSTTQTTLATSSSSANVSVGNPKSHSSGIEKFLGNVLIGTTDIAMTTVVIPQSCNSLYSKIGDWTCHPEDIDCKMKWINSWSNWTCQNAGVVAYVVARKSMG